MISDERAIELEKAAFERGDFSPDPECPFCGSISNFHERADFSNDYRVCNGCGARGPIVEAEDAYDKPDGDKIMAAKTLAAWTKRARATALARQLEVALREGSDFYAGRYAERCGQLAESEARATALARQLEEATAQWNQHSTALVNLTAHAADLQRQLEARDEAERQHCRNDGPCSRMPITAPKEP